MAKLKAKRKKLDPTREKQIRAQIDGYAKRPKDFRTDPTRLMRDPKTGLILAPSNDDYGTPERRGHDTVEIEGEKAQAHARVVTATVLDTMLHRKELDFDKKEGDHHRLWLAGDRLRRDFHMAGMEPRVISTLTQLPAGKGELSDNAIDARRRIKLAGQAVGPVLEPILVHVVCHDQPATRWGKRRGWRADLEAMTLFRAALQALAFHYGY